MTDPIGSIGAGAQSEVDLAARGGSRFLSRLQQLADAKDAHDEALAALNLGLQAKAALDAARDTHAEAARVHGEATQRLADAHVEFERILGTARDNAQRIDADAKQRLAEIEAEAVRMKEEANAYYARVTGEADALLEQARAAAAAAQEAQAAADQAMAQARQLEAQATGRAHHAAVMIERMKDVATRLGAAIADLPLAELTVDGQPERN
jgi:hypothetical protein